VPERADAVRLFDPARPLGGWSFGNGPEFPGAKGSLELDPAATGTGPALRLFGDFTGGGNYVQAAYQFPQGLGVEELSFKVRAPSAEKICLRLVDATDQCHQINLKLAKTDGWQEVRLPVAEFFALMAAGRSLDMVARYEFWGGAKDSRWHDPGKLLAILLGRDAVPATLKGPIWIADATVVRGGSAPTSVSRTVRLDDLVSEGELDWGFSLGEEFPGAKGSLELLKDEPRKGAAALRLRGDFSGGGAYVAAMKGLEDLGAESLQAIRLLVRSETARSYSLRLVDSTGQCHQKKGVPLASDGRWHEAAIVPHEVAGGEHWGGANDGRWHDPAKLVAFVLGRDANPDGKQAELLLGDIRAEIVVRARAKPPAYRESFETGERLPPGWRSTGLASVSEGVAFEGRRSLRLERSLDRLRDETRAVGAAFAASSGIWRVSGATRTELHSPDNSYCGVVGVEALDAGGSPLERIVVLTRHGRGDWQGFEQQVELPKGTAAARFFAELQKTYGTFLVDELAAAHLVTAERRVERIVLSSDRLGNLFLPEDRPVIRASVESARPLAESERRLVYTVRDYWGSEQAAPGECLLERRGRQAGRFVYAAELDLGAVPLELGRYYELHVELPAVSGETPREYTGFARLPLAESKKHRPEDVPFTIRNWDSRIKEYFYLADRLGIRQLGVWGGWEEKPPYKPHLPGLETCLELGAKWVTGTPGHSVEYEGFAKYSEEALRVGMRNFLAEYASRGLMMVCLGNEPHGGREKVKENVRAYKALYEAAKAFDPKVFVVGTSVEPNRHYFEEGYHRYLDAYDFHIYESYKDVRRTIREYRSLMKEFGAEKPILSTELGLNSQGQTRLVVACELVKKLVALFAEGGASASWFTIMYPDPDGKARGQAGDSHCVFDCKYSRYNPRLDAIAYYDMVNGICVKKFTSEREYPNGVQAYLFRDASGRSLLVLWRDGPREDVLVPLPGVDEAELVRIDGSRAKLFPDRGGVTLGVSEEPLLLLFAQGEGKLAEALGEPAIRVEPRAPATTKGGSCSLALRGRGATMRTVRVVAPPFWKAELSQAGAETLECRVTAPERTAAREGRLHIQTLGPAGRPSGEVTASLRLEGRER